MWLALTRIQEHEKGVVSENSNALKCHDLRRPLIHWLYWSTDFICGSGSRKRLTSNELRYGCGWRSPEFRSTKRALLICRKVGPGRSQEIPVPAAPTPQPRATTAASEHLNLMTEREVFEGQ